MRRSHGNNSTAWLGALLATALLASAQPARAQIGAGLDSGAALNPQAQPQFRAPEQTAEVFYKWYMEALYTSADPLFKAPQHMAEFVSTGLIADLQKRNRRKGLHADYFIQAQNFREDWATDIAVGKPRIVGKWATVAVTLGATEQTRRTLVLTLAREGREWKIRMVRLA
ncbi:MAG: DUF3828 domain-containing protein [Massilia sp.]